MACAAENNLEEHLCCEICKETFRCPKALPCGHTFCEQCLTEMASLGDLRCPICRRDVPLPDGVAGLPVNYRIAELCETISKKPADQDQDVTQNCEYHPSKELQLICKSSECDGKPICMQCFEDSHVGHKRYVVPVKTEANEQMKKLITPLLKEKKKQVEVRQKYLKEIQDLENLITDGKNESEKKIEDSYAERVRLLTEDKDRLLKDMQQNYADNMRDFNAKKDAVQQQLKDLTDIIEEVEQTKTDPIKFLDEKDNLRDKLKRTKVDALTTLEVKATFCGSHEINKNHLTNGELVTEVFTIRETTRWWSATELRSSIRRKAQTARETVFNTFRH